MAFKFIAFATLVAAASAGLLPAAHQAYHVSHSAPVAYTHGEPLAHVAPVEKELPKSHEPEPYDHNPQYSYSYEVHDPHTGDIKSQEETRNGDVVKGSYRFIEADGTRRIVHYTADHDHGFNAVVVNEPTQYAPVKHAEPVYAKVAHPVAQAPIAYQYATPIVEEAAPAHTEQEHAAPAHAEQEHAAPAHAEQEYAAPAQAEQEHAAPAQAEQKQAEPAHAEQKHAEPAHAEQAETEPAFSYTYYYY